MDLEYSSYLRGLLEQVELTNLLPFLSLTPEECKQLSNVSDDVTTCPHQEEGILASNIVFAVIKRLRQLRGDHPELIAQIEPSILTQAIIERSERPSPKWFRLCASPHGHLNGTPTEEFVATFLSRALQSQASVFFQRHSFVVRSEHTPGENETAHDSPIVIRITDSLIDGAVRRNGDVRDLIVARGGRLTPDDVFMIFFLTGSKELDVNPYLERSGGRQNPIWLLDRFLHTVKSFPVGPALSSDDLLRSRSTAQRQFAAQGQFVPGIASVSELLRIRADLLKLLSGGSPGLFFFRLLRTVLTFFCDYQRPEVRRAIETGGAESPLYLLAAGNLASQVAIRTLGRVVFSNESKSVHLGDGEGVVLWQSVRRSVPPMP